MGPDWCSVSADGVIAKCMRVADGAYRTNSDKNGTEYHLHRIASATSAASAPPPVPLGASSGRANADTLHNVYSALLSALRLSPSHREALRNRGLPDEEIDRGGYRTLPVQGRARLANELRQRFGDTLLRVPGFAVKASRAGSRYVTIRGAAGLLVPIRDAAQGIIGLIVRRDADGPGKYVWISSTKDGGPGPGAPVHVPLGVTGPTELARATEGALKADIAQALSGVPTIGIPGVTIWRPAIAVLRELGVRTVRLAIDNDARDKSSVARPLSAFAEALVAEGFIIELERWPAEHKGIDDALAAKVPIEVLTGDAARQAIGETLTEATANEPPQESSALDRIAVVLSDGPEAFFRDAELLRALALLAEDNPAEFACHRARLRGAGIRLPDLDKALSPLRRELRRARPPIDAAGSYRIVGGRIVRVVLTRDGPVEVPLANWSARIVEEIVHDDGAERRMTFAVEGALSDGTPLPRTEVGADKFPSMRWPIETWGSRAVVFAGASTADHLRTAIQLLSPDAPRRVVYGHTGWREINGAWFYLHAGGAIGLTGAVEGVSVELPDSLARFELPTPPDGEQLVASVRASLRLLDLGPDRITVPVLAAVFRAVLGESDFGVHVAGPTGVFKSELAALAQQFFGAGMDARHLPASWASTGNALEGLAFAAMHALLVTDDFAPAGSTSDVQRAHREADRILRAQGNRAGRQRMRPDATIRPPRPPRGLIFSTGEDVPRGQSLRARLFVLEISVGDILAADLTVAQGEAGLYAKCMAGFLRWLAARYDTFRAGMRTKYAEFRQRATGGGERGHARTPGIVADLALGLDCFLDFAHEVGTLDTLCRDAIAKRGWQALAEAGQAQAEPIEAAEPSGFFLRLLAGAISSGRAHVASPKGTEPDNPEAWGWRSTPQASPDEHYAGKANRWTAQGRRIGWLDDGALYLQPDAAFAEAQEMARHQGEALPVAPRTLWRRMRERGLLASWDSARQRNTIRRTLEGVKDREVVHVLAEALNSRIRLSEPSAEPGTEPEPRGQRTILADGDFRETDVRPLEPSVEQQENWDGGRFGRSDTRNENGAPRNGAPQPSPNGQRPDPSRPFFVTLENGRVEKLPAGAEIPSDAICWTCEGDEAWHRVRN
jgi:hypothetical protein